MKRHCAANIVFDSDTMEVLGCHPTGEAWDIDGCFDLPKGHIEEGEQPIDAAVRELKEEIGLSVPKSQLRYKGLFEYTKNKDLEVFFIPMSFEKTFGDVENLKCTSFFEDEDGVELPEVNGYAKILVPEQLHFFRYGLKIIIEKVLVDYLEIDD